MTDGMNARHLALAAAGLVLLAGATPARAGTTNRVSIGSDGSQGLADSGLQELAISANGRFVAFTSQATDLVSGAGNAQDEIFVRDLLTRTTARVSVGPQGPETNSGNSHNPSPSASGRFVAFWSYADNFVPDDTNNFPDVFVRDLKVGTTERVSVGAGGAQADGVSAVPSISGNGRFVAFSSNADNLVELDTNSFADIFVRDRKLGTTERVSVATGGAQADGDSSLVAQAVSADGRFVAFWSNADNFVPGDTNGATDVFVRDRQYGTTERASVATGGAQADGGSVGASISTDGRYVAFWSDATNLVPDDTNGATDVFVRDRQLGTTERISVRSDGTQADGSSDAPSISAAGDRVAFESVARNLVSHDTNGAMDVFVRRR